jgi:hypothetical protein
LIGLKNFLEIKGIGHFVAGTCFRFNYLCKTAIGFIIEDDPTHRINWEDLLKNFLYAPGGSSIRNVNHWIQILDSQSLSPYDYGKQINLDKYGHELPPSYDVERFKSYKVKSFMTVSDADPFSKKEDCYHIFQHINSSVITVKELTKYNHLDYLWSNDAKGDIYHHIIDFLK